MSRGIPTNEKNNTKKQYIISSSGGGGGSGDALSLRGVLLEENADTPSDGDVWVYRLATNEWILEPKPAGGTASTVADLTDTTITSITDNEIFSYDTGTSQWINQTPAELGLSVVGHSHVAADITDFDTEVSNNVDVAANTTDRHTHANKSILDATTQSFLTSHKTKLDYITISSAQNLNTVINIGDNISDLTNDSGYITTYNVTQGDVTAHQAALSITESQISDLGNYTVVGHQHVVADITDFSSVLSGTTNTSAFTPSADYHPATKKYVDDNIGTGGIQGPNPSTNHTIARWDGISGLVLDDTGVTISDTDVMGGITQLNVDNIRIDGNTISSTDVDGNINLQANGNGDIYIGSFIYYDTSENRFAVGSGDITFAPAANLGVVNSNIGITDGYSIVDEDNNNEILTLNSTGGTAFNNVAISNANTTLAPVISVVGGDANISLDLQAKGTGDVTVGGSPILVESMLTGNDGNVVSGTAGTGGNLVEWDANGDVVDSGVASASLVTENSTNTLTNKRITKRTGSTASTASLTVNSDDYDTYSVTALAENMTINALTGTPTNGQEFTFMIVDDGTGRSLIWDATYNSLGFPLPANTESSIPTIVKVRYNGLNMNWDVVAVSDYSFGNSAYKNTTGNDANVVSGTAGTGGNLVQWNGDGDAVGSGIAASFVVVGEQAGTKTWVGTQAAYDALGSYDANTLYFTTV